MCNKILLHVIIAHPMFEFDFVPTDPLFICTGLVQYMICYHITVQMSELCHIICGQGHTYIHI